jgi:uridylate kinase
VVEEIAACAEQHQIIVGMGGGTRSRHAYSIGLELGLPTGIIAALGASTSLQNAHLMQMLLAKHGGILTSFEEFEKLPLYLRVGCIPIMIGMPPFHHWERPPVTGRIPANRTDTGVYLMAEFLGARSMIYVKDEDGLYTDDPKKNPDATFIPKISAQELLDMDPNDLGLSSGSSWNICSGLSTSARFRSSTDSNLAYSHGLWLVNTSGRLSIRHQLRARGAPALFPSPSLLTFADARRGDHKRDCRINPPQPKQGVCGEADQHRAGEDRAQDILRSLAVGGARAELFADPLFCPPEPRTQRKRAGRQDDAKPASLGSRALDQRLDCFGRHIRGKQEEADRHPFLRAALGIG